MPSFSSFVVVQVAIFVAGKTKKFLSVGVCVPVLVGASTREKSVVANVNDSVWALNGDAVVLNCRHPATSGDIWSQRAANGTESAAPGPVRVANVGSTLTVSMSPSLNGTSYKCILTDFRGTRIFESGWIALFLGGRRGRSLTISISMYTFFT